MTGRMKTKQPLRSLLTTFAGFCSLIWPGASAVAVPQILVSPVSQTVQVGQSATFQVQADGVAPLSFQWSQDGVSLSDATNSTLTLLDVQLAQAGNYTVTVSDSEG